MGPSVEIILFLFLYFAEETQPEQPCEKPKVKAKSEEKEIREKPATTKLDINKLRSVVQRNILDNDRRQQKAEARKSETSRVEVDAEKSEAGAGGDLENVKAEKGDNYHQAETENGPSEKKKKKKKRRQDRPDCLVSQRTLHCADSKSEEFDSSSKSNAGNRFSRVAGPREKPR